MHNRLLFKDLPHYTIYRLSSNDSFQYAPTVHCRLLNVNFGRLSPFADRKKWVLKSTVNGHYWPIVPDQELCINKDSCD